MNIAEAYFRELRDIHSSGSAVKETSYYGPLANLLNAVGKQVTPRVQCIIHLQNKGVGIPDGGLFTELALEAQTGNIGHYQTVTPDLNLGLIFRPTNTSADYGSWPLLTELFPVSRPGIKTSRDSVVVDIDRDRLETRMKMYFDLNISFEDLQRVMPDATHTTKRFNAKEVRKYLVARGYRPENLVKYNYRPLDLRWLYWEQETKLLDEKRTEAQIHNVPGNFWLEARQKQPMEIFDRGYVARTFSDNLGNGLSSYFPLYLSEAASLPGSTAINLNLPSKAVELANNAALSKESIFFHVIAVLNTPAYRQANNDALRQDWPRIPLPKTAMLLSVSAELGSQVADLLDPDSSVNGITTGAIRPELRTLAVISTVARGGQLNPAKDLEITAKWGHYGKDNAVMPAKGKNIIREYSPEELKALGPRLKRSRFSVSAQSISI